MRLLITGGSRFDPGIARDLYGLGLVLVNGYGLTETSGAATVVRPGDRFTTSVGPPLPGVDIRIIPDSRLDADGIPGSGEVLVRGGVVMREYFNRPDATADALRDGWLYTGDLGYLDGDGRLFITGRKKDVIVLSSGKNLYPEEIEAHYRQSPFVKELCVLGLTRPDQPSAERLHAVIVPDDDALRARGAVNVRELVRFEIEGLSVRLPAHKRILTYDIAREPLPRTTTGKLKRNDIERRLRAQLATSQAAATTDGALAPRTLSAGEQEWLREPRYRAAVEALARHLHVPTVAPDANLELDLGLDSMERVEVLTALEGQHGRRVSPAVRTTIFTVRQLVESVIGAAESGHVAGTESGSPERTWISILAESPDAAIARDLGRPTFVRAFVLYGGLQLLATLARLVVRVRVTGREHLPASGPCLICPNHQSHLDGFFLTAALPSDCSASCSWWVRPSTSRRP
jgi:long-chain acyl-CoA synthetase